jgi:hypothetical protein
MLSQMEQIRDSFISNMYYRIERRYTTYHTLFLFSFFPTSSSQPSELEVSIDRVLIFESSLSEEVECIRGYLVVLGSIVISKVEYK